MFTRVKWLHVSGASSAGLVPTAVVALGGCQAGLSIQLWGEASSIPPAPSGAKLCSPLKSPSLKT